MTPPDAIPELLLTQARAGDLAALGQLLELYRNYLRLIALDARWRARAQARSLGPCSGDVSEGAPPVRRFRRRRRTRIHRLAAADPGANGGGPGPVPPGQRPQPAPRGCPGRLARPGRRRAAQQARWPTRFHRRARWRSTRADPCCLADALEKLPADYRTVFTLRNMEQIPFNEIAVRLGRSPGAVRMLWTRAMQRLSASWRRDHRR